MLVNKFSDYGAIIYKTKSTLSKESIFVSCIYLDAYKGESTSTLTNLCFWAIGRFCIEVFNI